MAYVAVLALGCGGRTSGSRAGSGSAPGERGSVSAGVSSGAATGLLVGSGLSSTGTNGSGGSEAVSGGSEAVSGGSEAVSGGSEAVSGGSEAVSGGSEAVSGGAAACMAAGGQCIAGAGADFCANVGPGATAASCHDVSWDMLCCAVDEDAGCTEIEASSYDESCKSDSDCVTVNVGSTCSACVFACGQNVGAINAGAMAQYTADVAKTPAGAIPCFCPTGGLGVPCCRSGQCHAGNECSSLDGSTADAEPIPSDAGAGAPSPPSCGPGGPGMTNCGPGGRGTESCCTSLEVAGGTFFRTYDVDSNTYPVLPQEGGPTGEADPATVSSFRLDKYLVTVARFRQFLSAWSGGAGWLPPAGSGKHLHLNGGAGLVSAGQPETYEPGWVTSDDAAVAPTSSNLDCGLYDYVGTSSGTWTLAPGANENLPINCVNWSEAYAFCIWDGGFLPSEAEWEYAAAGGNQQRVYPWGSKDPGTENEFAIYGCHYPSGPPDASPFGCTGAGDIAPVGTATLGAGLWGQLDLAGEVWVWNLDRYAAYMACTDCGDFTASVVDDRTLRGGGFSSSKAYLIPPSRANLNGPRLRSSDLGFRCARSP